MQLDLITINPRLNCCTHCGIILLQVTLTSTHSMRSLLVNSAQPPGPPAHQPGGAGASLQTHCRRLDDASPALCPVPGSGRSARTSGGRLCSHNLQPTQPCTRCGSFILAYSTPSPRSHHAWRAHPACAHSYRLPCPLSTTHPRFVFFTPPCGHRPAESMYMHPSASTA